MSETREREKQTPEGDVFINLLQMHNRSDEEAKWE
jgi:hypothetical protein